MALQDEREALYAAATEPGSLPGPLPDHLQDPLPATYWSAGYDTPVWQKLPLFNAGAVRDCLTSIEFQAPIYISVSNVDRGNFRRLKVDYTTAIEMIAQVSEPCVTLVDASRQVVALFPQEYAVLVLRGTVDDWPTD